MFSQNDFNKLTLACTHSIHFTLCYSISSYSGPSILPPLSTGDHALEKSMSDKQKYTICCVHYDSKENIIYHHLKLIRNINNSYFLLVFLFKPPTLTYSFTLSPNSVPRCYGLGLLGVNGLEAMYPSWIVTERKWNPEQMMSSTKTSGPCDVSLKEC